MLISTGELELNAELQVLQDLGVLIPSNKLDYHELLNPPGEFVQDTTLWTPEEIFAHARAVTIPQSASVSQSRPTVKESLEAVKLLLTFVETDDSVEGQVLEPALERFERRLRSCLKGHGDSGRQVRVANVVEEQEGVTEKEETMTPVVSEKVEQSLE